MNYCFKFYFAKGELRLLCFLRKGVEEKKYLAMEKEAFDFLEKSEGLFFKGQLEEGITEKGDRVFEYLFWDLYGLEDSFVWEFNNKKELEVVMSQRAPKKLWSLKALLAECKRKNIKVAKDETDKGVLAALLDAVDVAEVEEEVEELVEDGVEGEELEDEVEGEELVEEEVEGEELEEELVEEELEDGVEGEELVEEEVEGEELEEELVEEEENQKPEQKKEKAMKKESTEKAGKTGKAQVTLSAKDLNEKIRNKKLWRSGCQFLSNDEKLQLLRAKNAAEREVVYKLVEKKSKKSRAAQSKKMKEKYASGEMVPPTAKTKKSAGKK
jgi:hypothetical protein